MRIVTTLGRLVLAAALAAAGGNLAVGGGIPAARADDVEKKSVDADAVYFGNARDFSKAAEVDPDSVYAEIEEYKKILRDKLQASDPEYGILMSKASKKFLAAVRAAAKDGSYDLVARCGAVKGCGTLPNITADVKAKL